LNGWEVATLRSEINAALERAKPTPKNKSFRLPACVFRTPEEGRIKGTECDEIRDCKLGWDVADFDSGDVPRLGRVAFALGDGHPTLPRHRSAPCCEKAMIVGEAQRIPMRRHVAKQEDIIRRAGGNLASQVCRVAADGRLGCEDAALVLDGVSQQVPAGHRFGLERGQSIRRVRSFKNTMPRKAGRRRSTARSRW
jgi:D-lyxose ketol-isomerase